MSWRIKFFHRCLHFFVFRFSTPTPMRTTTGVMRKWILWLPRLSTSWRRGWRNWSSSLWNWRKVGTIVLMRNLHWRLLILPWWQNLPHMSRDWMSFIIKHISAVLLVFRLFSSSFSLRSHSLQISLDCTRKYWREHLVLIPVHAGLYAAWIIGPQLLLHMSVEILPKLQIIPAKKLK